MNANEVLTQIYQGEDNIHLSKSQVGTFDDCAQRWYYERTLPNERAIGVAGAIGIAYHDAVGTYFTQLRDTGEVMPVEKVVDRFDLTLNDQMASGRVLLEEGESIEAERTNGQRLVRYYVEKVAPTIKPLHIELSITMPIVVDESISTKFFLTGRIDLVDSNGRITDFKTTSRTPGNVHPEYKALMKEGKKVEAKKAPLFFFPSARNRFEMAVYRLLLRHEFGAPLEGIDKIDYLVPLANSVNRVVVPVRTTMADCQDVLNRLGAMVQQIAAGVFPPNRASFYCKPGGCSYYHRCFEEHGVMPAESSFNDGELVSLCQEWNK